MAVAGGSGWEHPSPDARCSAGGHGREAGLLEALAGGVAVRVPIRELDGGDVTTIASEKKRNGLNNLLQACSIWCNHVVAILDGMPENYLFSFFFFFFTLKNNVMIWKNAFNAYNTEYH